MTSSNTCNKCNKTFKTKNYLLKHLNKKNPCNQKYICENCNKEFTMQYLLNRHKNKKNPCEPKIKKINISADDKLKILELISSVLQ